MLFIKSQPVLFFLFNTIWGFSQTHMKFLDIPIDGKLEDFEKVLHNKKFLALLLAFIMVVLPLTSCDQLNELIEDEAFEEDEEGKEILESQN